MSQMVLKRARHGQSLIEFAILLPAVLLLILLIVRLMMILNAWYTITNAADMGVRAAALTGDAASAIQIVLDNLPEPAYDHQQVRIIFSPDVPKFGPQPTATVTSTAVLTKTPGKALPATLTPLPTWTPRPSKTPDQLAPITLSNITDYPISIYVVYDLPIAGPLIPAWKITLSAKATARLETRVTPLPKREFF